LARAGSLLPAVVRLAVLLRPVLPRFVVRLRRVLLLPLLCLAVLLRPLLWRVLLSVVRLAVLRRTWGLR
jgi:hypothetical protein